MEPLYQVGDIVRLKDSCEEDIGTYAWLYIKTHRLATVRTVSNPGLGFVYGLEWDEDFEGGHDCWRNITQHRGQFVTEKHLELENFEASSEVITIPNLGDVHDQEDIKDSKENNL